jgi:flagellar biosynthesis/type III secretory pathway M-ring protein FliF/YscJ
MSEVVSARDLVPEAYDEGSEEEEEVENREDIVDDLEYDLFNLSASNYHTVRLDKGTSLEELLVERTERAAQLIMKKYVVYQ